MYLHHVFSKVFEMLKRKLECFRSEEVFYSMRAISQASAHIIGAVLYVTWGISMRL